MGAGTGARRDWCLRASREWQAHCVISPSMKITIMFDLCGNVEKVIRIFELARSLGPLPHSGRSAAAEEPGR